MSNLDALGQGLGYAGKTVVVTGGSSGMGEATARILCELGARVHIVDIQPPKVQHASFRQCDLSDFDQIRTTAAGLADVAPIDFVFPCAGLPPHVKGAMYCMRVNYIGTRLFVETGCRTRRWNWATRAASGSTQSAPARPGPPSSMLRKTS